MILLIIIIVQQYLFGYQWPILPKLPILFYCEKKADGHQNKAFLRFMNMDLSRRSKSPDLM